MLRGKPNPGWEGPARVQRLAEMREINFPLGDGRGGWPQALGLQDQPVGYPRPTPAPGPSVLLQAVRPLALPPRRRKADLLKAGHLLVRVARVHRSHRRRRGDPGGTSALAWRLNRRARFPSGPTLHPPCSMRNPLSSGRKCATCRPRMRLAVPHVQPNWWLRSRMSPGQDATSRRRSPTTASAIGVVNRRSTVTTCVHACRCGVERK